MAIVGIGCRFPGGVSDAESFWRLLSEGKDAITEIPRDRIDLDHYFDAAPATPGRMMTRWGGYLDRIDEFDADFFGISPREAERMDPQQRLLLETAWEALEDAGQDLKRIDQPLSQRIRRSMDKRFRIAPVRRSRDRGLLHDHREPADTPHPAGCPICLAFVAPASRSIPRALRRWRQSIWRFAASVTARAAWLWRAASISSCNHISASPIPRAA